MACSICLIIQRKRSIADIYVTERKKSVRYIERCPLYWEVSAILRGVRYIEVNSYIIISTGPLLAVRYSEVSAICLWCPLLGGFTDSKYWKFRLRQNLNTISLNEVTKVQLSEAMVSHIGVSPLLLLRHNSKSAHATGMGFLLLVKE